MYGKSYNNQYFTITKMIDETIIALSLTGGVAVLTGYYFVAVTGVGTK